MNWIRRVRSWEAVVTAGMKDGPVTFHIPLFGVMNSDPLVLEASEADRVCTLRTMSGSQTIEIPDGMGDGSAYRMTAAAAILWSYFGDGNTGYPTCGYAEPHYYPRMRVIIEITGNTPPDHRAESVEWSTEEEAYELGGTFHGRNLTFEVLSTSSSEEHPWLVTSIAIVPTGWWEFAKPDGSDPLLDASTGQRLPNVSVLGAS